MNRMLVRILACSLSFSLSLSSPVGKPLDLSSNWDPKSYTAHDIIMRNGEKTRYYEGGCKDGVPLIFLHGWPGIAETWKHQLDHFAKLNYRVIAPDMRGYGDSTAPKNKRAYSRIALTQEYVEFAKRLNIKKAVWVAHDWGNGVTHPLAAHNPELFLGTASLAIPFHTFGRGLDYLKTLVNRDLYPEDEYPYGQFDYIRYYETNTWDAIREFESEIPRLTKNIFQPRNPNNTDLRSPQSNITRDGGWFGGSAQNLPDVPLNTTLLDQSLYNNLVKSYNKHGFFGATSYYLNSDIDSLFTLSEKNGGVVDFPTLYIDPVDDRVASATISPLMGEAQANYTTNLTYEKVVADHWVQLEKPDEVNAILEKWLNKIL